MPKPFGDLLSLGSAPGVMIIAGAITIVGGAIATAWWRRYFRRLFEAGLQDQEDGTYLVHWRSRRGQPVELYRIDSLTKERVLAWLVGGSVVSTGLFVAIIIATVAISVLRTTLLTIPASLLLAILAFAPQRYATLQAGRLVVTGARIINDAEVIRGSAAPSKVDTTSLRLMVWVSCFGAAVGLAICVTFFLDPDSKTMAWTQGFALLALLVGLPLSAAILSWRLLRRT
jgi:hypothetical protein